MGETPPIGKPCAFCGTPMLKAAGTQATKEHGFPKWLLQYLGEPGGEVTHTIRENLSGRILREWTTAELDIAARKVCRPCNNGWMNDLENRARPHLVPLIEGQIRVLDAPTQQIIAAWAVKTALALALANEGSAPVDPRHYRAMAELKRRPPAHTHVWIASYQGPSHGFFYQSRLNMDLRPSGDSAEGYAVTFSVMRPIFHVVGHSYKEEVSLTKGGAWPYMTAQLWPILGLAHWPTPVVVPDSGLHSIARAWE